ncbi:MAG: type II toxin-antitoxin system Phd/YefM family antitoxin [Pseudomonadota bacterium]
MINPATSTSTPAWRLQDAKAQFSALVDKALLGVPQHVTRSGKPAVVVLSEQDFEALQQSAASHSAAAPTSFIDHLLAMPKAAADEQADLPRLDVTPREVDFS